MQLQIEKLVYGGDGLGRLPGDEHGQGKTVFVPFVIPGEKVEASVLKDRPGFVQGKLDVVLAPSPQRVEPGCPYFTRCGGCHYQHIDYQAQLHYKSEILRETLRRTAKLELEAPIQVHAAEPWQYRNRSRLQVRHRPEFALGYYRINSHEVLAVEACPISSPLLNRGITTLWELGRQGAVPEAVRGLQLFANHDDTKLLVEAYVAPKDVSGAPSRNAHLGPVAEQEHQQFAAVLRRAVPELVGIALFPARNLEDDDGQRSPLASFEAQASQIIGDTALFYRTDGGEYRISGGSFFQTNRFLVGELVSCVVGQRTGRAALDLYAGAGLFTQPLARNFDQVIAVESSPQSFDDLRANVPPNVKCVRSTTERFLAERGAKLAPDLVVVDPPRAGLGEATTTALCRMNVPRVIYVSCDPATLSRDLRMLLESEFRVEQAHLVDMFPQTFHLETVLHLAR